MIKKLILASSSTARARLLQQLHIPFEIVHPDIDETAKPEESAQDLVQRLAKEKAEVKKSHYPNALIIGVDQVGVINNRILGKPLNYENAFEHLQFASGKQMDFYCGLCVYDTSNNTHLLTLEKYSVFYKTLTDEMIKNYLKKEQPYHCAGSCDIEGLGITLIERLEGKDFSALVGLPLIQLTQMLQRSHLDPLSS